MGVLSLSLTIWLVKWTVASKVTAVRVHLDLVNTAAALTGNGGYFVRLTVMWEVAAERSCIRGTGDCTRMTQV